MLLFLIVMHERKEIIKNQSKFEKEIIQWLKNDFKQTKKELFNIESKDKTIELEKKKLISKTKKVKLEKQIQILFIGENNIYPRMYAWWDEENSEVKIFRYLNETR